MTVRSPLRWLLVLALAAGASLLLHAVPANAARGMEVAISDEDAMVKGTGGDLGLAFRTAQALNATRMRILVEWARVSDANDPVASSNPDYDWGPIDRAIDTAASYGMRTQLALAGPPPAYASGTGRVSIPIWTPDAAAYGNFARAAAEHFQGRVDRYSIWNEPNYPSWLEPRSQSPQLYRALYEAGYAAIKSVDPSAQVLIGETVPYGGKAIVDTGKKGKDGKPIRRGKRLGLAAAPLRWLRAVACVNARYRRIGNCTPLHADGYAHHPYDLEFGAATGSPLSKTFPGADNAPIQTLPNLRKALDKLAGVGALATPGGKPLNIYLTESGYFVSGKRKLAAAKRAKYLPQQFQIAATQRRVREMLQYNVFAPSSGFTTGLLTPDGRPLAEYKTLLAWTRRAAKGGLIKRNTGPIMLPPAPLS
ncbi:MAG: hypothetical protein ACJ76G_12820 [Solirubrobacterales bacterium]